jgi:nicotinate-nucleotide adenylyltransferase
MTAPDGVPAPTGEGGSSNGNASRGERVGVFGGTFDPIHVGHLSVALQAKHQLRLDRVLLVVSNVPWQKASSRNISDPEVRYAMVERSVAGHEGLEASRIEIDRGGDSVTADTLEALQSPGRELFLLIGSDLVNDLPTWRRWDSLRSLCTLAVVYRPGGETHWSLPDDWANVRVEGPAIHLSSSELRAMVKKGAPIDFLVPSAAIDLIVRKNLYVVPAETPAAQP